MEKDVLSRLSRALAGTVTVEEGYDLTQPACPEWAEIIEDPNWNAWTADLPKPPLSPKSKTRR